MRQFQSLSVAMLICFAVFVGLSSSHGDEPYFAGSQPPSVSLVEEHQDWMANIRDATLVSQLSLPGTHDTCSTADRVGYSGALARTQWWTLEDQLRAGIRFLDIRCRQVEDRFQIHHGLVDLGLDFAEVRDRCEAFLKEHPTECLVMNIQREYTVEGKANFGDVFQGYLEGHESFWALDVMNPRLEQVRGKVLLLSRNQELDERLDPQLRWRHCRIANDWEGPSFEEKWAGCRANLDRARRVTTSDSGNEDKPWHLTFTSATSLPFRTPNKYALELNSRLFYWLEENPQGSLGMVAIDFPGEELIRRIIRSNKGWSKVDE